jgi:hypothetical protein
MEDQDEDSEIESVNLNDDNDNDDNELGPLTKRRLKSYGAGGAEDRNEAEDRYEEGGELEDEDNDDDE